MLDFIYYPVSFILWCWHKVFGFAFGEDNAFAWILGIVFLTFTVRGIMFKPFMNQVRSMRKMQDFAPEIKKVQKKYANDRQRQAQEMQRLQREHGVNPLGSCLPMLLQIPVFIGLNRVLRNFQPGEESNYFFDQAGVTSYVNAKIFGVNLGDAINGFAGIGGGGTSEGWNWDVAPVAVPLMIVASVATHFSARHSASRQNPASSSQQTAMMNKLTMYVFPAGLLVFGAFLPIGLLLYFLSNNIWTLGQQRFVYTRIDREEEAKKEAAAQKRTNLAPKPGQKPVKKEPAKTGQGTSQRSGGQSSEKGSGQRQTGSSSSGSTTSVPNNGANATSAEATKSENTQKSRSNLRGGAWAKHGGNQRGQAAQGKKTQGRKRR